MNLTVLGFKNAKINFFEEKNKLSAVFIDLKYGLLQTCLTDMKKQNIRGSINNLMSYLFLDTSSRYFADIIDDIIRL